MSQDHNARNRNHYVDFSRLRLHRSIASIDLIRGTYHAYRAYHALFFGAAPALYDPTGLAPALSSHSSLSSHIFCASPEENDRQKVTDGTDRQKVTDGTYPQSCGDKTRGYLFKTSDSRRQLARAEDRVALVNRVVHDPGRNEGLQEVNARRSGRAGQTPGF
jgi:hypothetical protein